VLNRELKRCGSWSASSSAPSTGARITPVEGSAADNLADAGGIAALVRW
jgi:hypothetical protein